MAPEKHWSDETFGPLLCRANGKCSKPSEVLKDKEFVGVYFSAQWCGYCTRFTPMLESFYKAVSGQDNKLEIVYVNSGDTLQNFEASTRSSPWLHVPMAASQQLGYIQRSIRQATGGPNGVLASKYEVQALPTLVLLRGRDGKVLKNTARHDVASGASASEIVSRWEDHLREAENYSKIPWIGFGLVFVTGMLGSMLVTGAKRNDRRR